jgi:hypothetical protein
LRCRSLSVALLIAFRKGANDEIHYQTRNDSNSFGRFSLNVFFDSHYSILEIHEHFIMANYHYGIYHVRNLFRRVHIYVASLEQKNMKRLVDKFGAFTLLQMLTSGIALGIIEMLYSPKDMGPIPEIAWILTMIVLLVLHRVL